MEQPTPNVPEGAGGRGRCRLSDLWEDAQDHQHARGTAGLLARALKAGYLDAFCIDYDKLREYANWLATQEKPRLKAAGSRLLLAMAAHDLELFKMLDKSKRLDGGLPTENVNSTIRYIKGVDEGEL